MSAHRSVRNYFRNVLLIVLHLMAVLLPTQPATAQGTAAACGGESVRAASVAPFAVASADEEVVIPKEEVDRSYYDAYWRIQFGQDVFEAENEIMDVLFKNGGLQTYSILAGEFREKFFQAMAEKTSWYHGGNYDLMVHTAFNLAWETPGLKYAVAGAWRDLIDNDSLFATVDHKLAQSAERYSMRDKMVELAEDARIEIYDCAQEDPEYAEAYDDLHKEPSTGKPVVSIRDDAKTIVQKIPSLPMPAKITERIREDGTLKISLNELKEATATEFGKLHTTLDDMQETLVEIDKQQDVIVKYLKDQEAKAKLQEEVKKKAEEYQLKLDAAKASISVLSTLTGLLDRDLGKQIGTVGNSTIKVGAAINNWLKAVSGLNGLEKVASMSTIVMTGNVLGAVMEVVALFGEAKPTPEQMILEEIGKLRQQVDKLRTEMHGRFDRIDQSLNAIYTTMHDRFDKIDIQLGKINGNILEIQETLLTLDLQLSRIERNNFELINAVGRRDLLNAVNAGLDYEQRTGLQMPYEPDFIGYESTFHAWGTVHAYDPGNAGPTQRDFSDAKVLQELTTYPLDLNVNYLNGWLLANGLPAITDKFLASSRDWLFASRAYTQLGAEWPEHMQEVDSGRQAKLDQVGFELETAMQNISTRQTAAGPIGNTLLFSSVITYYEDKLGALNSAIPPLEAAYGAEIQASLQRAEPFNLYGGTNQPLTYVTPEINNLTCGDAQINGTRQLSSNLKVLIPNFDLYNLADYLRLGKFAGCLTDEWQDLQMYSEDDPERPNDPPTYFWAGEHKAILTIYFDSVPLLRQTIDEGYVRMDFYLPDTWTRDNWTFAGGYKEKFDALTTADQPTPDMVAQQTELYNTVTAKAEKALAGYQKGLYQRLISEMTVGSLKGMAVELGGAKALMDAFTTLGLPNAVSEDEFLHAMLYGNQHLVDHNSIVGSYALSITQPISGANLLLNPRQVIWRTADERVEMYGQIVGEYLAAIAAETHVEAASYIADTRFVLDMTMRVVQLEPQDIPGSPTPAPGTPGTPGGPGTPGTPGTPEPQQPASIQQSYMPYVRR